MQTPHIPLIPRLRWLLLVACLAQGLQTLRADEAELPAAVGEEIARLIDALDAPEYSDRNRAAGRIEELLGQPQLGRALAIRFERALVRPRLSFEVRDQLQSWLDNLPPPFVAHAEEFSTDEIREALERLDGDLYSERIGATRHIRSMLQHPKRASKVLLAIETRLAAASPNRNAREELASLHELARGAWLLGDPADWKLPPVAREDIAAWLDAIAAEGPAPSAANQSKQELAGRKLVDLLARDDCREQVESMLSGRLASVKDDDARRRLEDVREWTRPAMVAEIWSDGRHVTVQHLLVDVPQVPEGAPRPTHFDRINDRTAHCVSGNSLLPGDYPVGIAIPHPNGRSNDDRVVMFHLVNLPTPRRRLAYEYHVRRGERERLKEISRRTLDAVLADKRRFSEQELLMLTQLDAEVLSKFAGPYFRAVADNELSKNEPLIPGQSSARGAIAIVLAASGTSDAVPALEQAARASTGELASLTSSRRMAWIAAMAIAERDPWPQVDDWLASLVNVSDSLLEPPPRDEPDSEPSAIHPDRLGRGPEVGATAAGMLLRRHGAGGPRSGMESAHDELLDQFNITPYRFTTPEARREFSRWWHDHKNELASRQRDGSA